MGTKFLILSLIVLSGVFLACKVAVNTLSDGKTKVPSKSSEYKNRIKFNNSILQLIDTNSIYIEVNPSRAISAYRFYPNGNFNYFVFTSTLDLKTVNLNPNYTGYRGVYYIEHEQVLGDLFAEKDQRGTIGKLERIFLFRGDSLFVERKFGYRELFIKKELPTSQTRYFSNW